MIGEWKALLLEKAGEWQLPAGGEWRFLFFNNYQPNYSTVSVLWFHDGARFPSVVLKLFRDPKIPREEFDNLKYVYSCVPNLVPRPLHFGPAGRFWTLWMEGVPGLPLSARKWYPREVLGSMVDMVLSIHTAVCRPAAVSALDRHCRLVTQPLRALAEFGTSSIVRHGCVELVAPLRPDWLAGLRVIPQHGDLFVGNLLAYRHQWRVVDWESFGAVDFPFYDLVTLLLSLLSMQGETPDQWDSLATAELPLLIERYATGLGLPRAALLPLLPLTLVNWFYLQLRDGRLDFATRMYKTIHHYFEHRDLWDNIFVPASTGLPGTPCIQPRS
jgi:hypothetical protein